MREALSIPKMIISVSGPSKSGKTVLVNKVIESDNLIPVSGASIRSPEDLWLKVLGWMEVPVERVETTGTKLKAEGGGKAGGEAGIPFVAQGRAHAEAKIGGETTREIKQSFETRGLQQVIKEIGASTFAVFVDDFHYIPKDAQKEIGKQIKEAAENGVRIVTASVPHRSDDVVRSNTELRGRVTAIDVDGDRIVAITNLCAHQGGPIGEGCIIDGLVTCPWHGFQYRFEDGCSPPPFTEKLMTHRVRINRGAVEVDPQPLPPGTSAAIRCRL